MTRFVARWLRVVYNAFPVRFVFVNWAGVAIWWADVAIYVTWVVIRGYNHG